jgi:hypothetical protein
MVAANAATFSQLHILLRTIITSVTEETLRVRTWELTILGVYLLTEAGQRAVRWKNGNRRGTETDC